MQNLLKETARHLSDHSLTPEDVAWVGSAGGEMAITWDQFAEIANFHYDAGYGGEEIALDLVVVFVNGSWLERHEYEGSEWWEYKATPERKPDAQPFARVQRADYESTLSAMNKENADA